MTARLMLAAAAWTIAIGVPHAQDAETPYAATRLIGRWRTIMNNTLEASRAFAAEDVLDEMEVFVSPGAVRAVQDKLNEEQLKKADAVVQRFAEEVVGAGGRRPDGSVIVEKDAVPKAEQRICPVYPFCAQ